MRKRIFLCILLSASVLSVLMIVNTGTKYENSILTESEYVQIKANKIKTEFDADVYFDGNKLFKDDNNRFYYSLIEKSKTAYNPKVSTDNGFDIAFLENRISDDLIKNNKHITFIIYNSDEYQEYELVCTTLPILMIESETENISTEDVDTNVFLFDNRENVYQRLIFSNAKIHERGGTSLGKYEKKHFKINLTVKSPGKNTRNNNIQLLGLREDSDYILYSPLNDPIKVRNVFSSNLWKESCALNNSYNIDNGFEYRFVELFINDNYMGLYALGYKVDTKTVNLKEDEIMYTKVSTDVNELLNEFNGDIVEGYEIKKNNSSKYTYEPLLEYYRVIKSYENRIHYDLLDEYVDLDNQIDYYLFINLIQGIDHSRFDGTLHNLFITAKKNGDWYKMLYTPWDMDRTWGLDDYVDGNDPKKNVVTLFSMANAMTYDADFVEKVKERYYELRQKEWSEEYLFNMLNDLEDDIYFSGAFLRDEERWPADTYTDAYYGDNDVALSEFKEYVTERLYYMDKYIEETLGN